MNITLLSLSIEVFEFEFSLSVCLSLSHPPLALFPHLTRPLLPVHSVNLLLSVPLGLLLQLAVTTAFVLCCSNTAQEGRWEGRKGEGKGVGGGGGGSRRRKTDLVRQTACYTGRIILALPSDSTGASSAARGTVDHTTRCHPLWRCVRWSLCSSLLLVLRDERTS